jgi:hypothetical protein
MTPDQLQAFLAWKQEIDLKQQNSPHPETDWANTKIDPKDLSFQMGPMLTEDQFKEYMKTTGSENVKIIRQKK